jgi:replicative DNA helicase
MSDIKEQVFAPQDVSVIAFKAVEARHQNKDGEIKTGIARLDRDLLPMRPGELIIVCGYTSNYKTGLMNYIARHNAQTLVDTSDGDFMVDYTKAVISFTWEQSVEEQGIVDIAQLSGVNAAKMMRGELADTEWVALTKGSIERGTLPWWVVGHSSEGGKRRPRLSMTDAGAALAHIADVQHLAPALVVLDYAQRIKQENANSRREGLMDIVDRAKDMALAFRCPVILGCQAGRGVKERTWRLPQLDDGQETSNLEQSADKFISVWMPKNDFPGQTIQGPGGKEITVTDNLLIIGIMKQKFGPAPLVNLYHVKPEINEIYPTETRVL